jgi:hypothetical protein
MKKFIFTIFSLLLSFSIIYADIDVLEKYDDSSSVSGKYLNLKAGAQGAGMGNAYIGMANNAVSMFWNPAGLTNMLKTGGEWNFFINHNIWIMDMMADNIAIAKKFEKIGVFGLGISYFNAGQIEKYDIDINNRYVEKGNFSPYSLIGTVSYSNIMDKDIDYGINLKYILDNIDNSILYTFAFDIGVRYFSPIKNLLFNIVAKNFGGRLGEFILSKELSFAATYSFEINEFLLSAETDICGIVNNYPVYNFGIELKTPSILILRSGYHTTNSFADGFKDFSFGIGLEMDGKNLDISFEPYGEFGNSLQLAISGSF